MKLLRHGTVKANNISHLQTPQKQTLPPFCSYHTNLICPPQHLTMSIYTRCMHETYSAHAYTQLYLTSSFPLPGYYKDEPQRRLQYCSWWGKSGWKSIVCLCTLTGIWDTGTCFVHGLPSVVLHAVLSFIMSLIKQWNAFSSFDVCFDDGLITHVPLLKYLTHKMTFEKESCHTV